MANIANGNTNVYTRLIFMTFANISQKYSHSIHNTFLYATFTFAIQTHSSNRKSSSIFAVFRRFRRFLLVIFPGLFVPLALKPWVRFFGAFFFVCVLFESSIINVIRRFDVCVCGSFVGRKKTNMKSSFVGSEGTRKHSQHQFQHTKIANQTQL